MDPIYEKSLFLLAGTILGLFSALVIRWIVSEFTAWRELKLLMYELDDIKRHCSANLRILQNMDLEKGKPSSMHFEKMKIPESSIIFSADTYRAIHKRHARLIYELKLVIRNINIEVSKLTDYSLSEAPQQTIMQEYISYVSGKMGYISDRLDYENKNFIGKKSVNTSQKNSTSVPIIYDAHFDTIKL